MRATECSFFHVKSLSTYALYKSLVIILPELIKKAAAVDWSAAIKPTISKPVNHKAFSSIKSIIWIRIKEWSLLGTSGKTSLMDKPRLFISALAPKRFEPTPWNVEKINNKAPTTAADPQIW